MQLAMHFCELVFRMTPLHQPSEGKFELLFQALSELENATFLSAFQASFTLRLMRLAGVGLDHPVLKNSPRFWQRMHEDPFSTLAFSSPQELLWLGKCNNICRRFLDQYLTYPLHTTQPLGLEETAALPAQEPVPVA